MVSIILIKRTVIVREPNERARQPTALTTSVALSD